MLAVSVCELTLWTAQGMDVPNYSWVIQGSRLGTDRCPLHVKGPGSSRCTGHLRSPWPQHSSCPQANEHLEAPCVLYLTTTDTAARLESPLVCRCLRTCKLPNNMPIPITSPSSSPSPFLWRSDSCDHGFESATWLLQPCSFSSTRSYIQQLDSTAPNLSRSDSFTG